MGADVEVVTKQIKLRDLLVGPVDAFEAGNWDWLSFDIHYQIAFRLFQFKKICNGDGVALFSRRAFNAGLFLGTCFRICHGWIRLCRAPGPCSH